MCELLVMTRDASDHPAALKQGDVVTVQEDGWVWGKEEENEDRGWVILKAPSVSVSEASVFTTPGRADEGQIAPARAFGLEWSKLEVMEIFTRRSLESAKLRRESVDDPRVIGGNPRVIS